jgi:hypothetical protein
MDKLQQQLMQARKALDDANRSIEELKHQPPPSPEIPIARLVSGNSYIMDRESFTGLHHTPRPTVTFIIKDEELPYQDKDHQWRDPMTNGPIFGSAATQDDRGRWRDVNTDEIIQAPAIKLHKDGKPIGRKNVPMIHFGDPKKARPIPSDARFYELPKETEAALAVA